MSTANRATGGLEPTAAIALVLTAVVVDAATVELATVELEVEAVPLDAVDAELVAAAGAAAAASVGSVSVEVELTAPATCGSCTVASAGTVAELGATNDSLVAADCAPAVVALAVAVAAPFEDPDEQAIQSRLTKEALNQRSWPIPGLTARDRSIAIYTPSGRRRQRRFI
jgi:hypothetical protein